MNELKNNKKFQKLLSAYRVSDTGKPLLKKTQLVLLVAPTASGRNTIIRELLKTGNYHYVVSDTTRKPRLNDGVMEKDGIEYWFRSEEQVLRDIELGQFLGAAIIHNQQVSGISLRELQEAYEEQKIAVTDIEVKGVESILGEKPDTTVLFIVPPNFDEWQRRLHHRGATDFTEVVRRMQSAVSELQHALHNDYYDFIVNDTVDHAISQIENRLHHPEDRDHQTARGIVEQLCQEAVVWLKANQ